MVVACAVALSLITSGTQTKLSRAEFAQQLYKLKYGESEEVVRRHLGKPDRVDLTEPSNPEARRYWRYGCEGPNSLATLGSVAIQKGKVIMVIGRGEPPKPATIGEAKLRQSLQKMYRITELDRVSGDDPLMMIQAANCLIALGQSKAIAVMKEFERVHRSDRRIRVLLRALFDVPSTGRFPLDPWIPDPTKLESKMNPHWPIIVKDDVVFTFQNGWGGAGNVGPIHLVLEPLSKSSKMRTKLFVPGDDPFLACERLFQSPDWPYRKMEDDPEYAHLILQTLRLVRTVYSPEEMKGESPSVNPKDFDRYHKEYLKLGARWDASKQRYVKASSALTGDRRM